MSSHENAESGQTPRRGATRSLLSQGFADEQARLAEAERVLTQGASADDYREGLATLAGHYRSLLAHTAKLTRIGDANQARLIRLQQAREAAERRYRSIFERALEGLFRIDSQGAFIDVNPAFLAMFGFANMAELKSHAESRLSGLYVEPATFDGLVERLRAGETIRDFEVQACRRDGSIFWAAQSLDGVQDDETGEALLQGAMIDITVRREAHEAMEHAMRAAEEANRAKSDFLAKVTHEFRTPLNGILGYSQLLKRQFEGDSKATDGLQCIQDSAEHLLGLIEDLLVHSRFESQRLELSEEDFSVRHFFRGVENQFKLRAMTAGLTFRLAIDPHLAEFWRSDPSKLRQVLFNLLGNALKFTERGQVTLTVSRDPATGLVTFAVEDTGCGISAEDLNRIFRPFEQAGDPATRRHGAGLGLAISRNLVELMGGQLNVRSRVGKGSCFFFSLELRSPEQALQHDAWRISGYEGPRYTLLLLAASAMAWVPYRRSLRDWGFELVEWTTADAGSTSGCALQPRLALAWLDPANGFDGVQLRRLMAPCAEVPLLTIEPREGAGAPIPGARRLFQPLSKEELARALADCLGIHWRFAGDEELPSEPSSALAVPDGALREELLALVNHGHFPALRRRLEHLRRESAEWAPFVEKALGLASSYQSDPLRQLLTREVTGQEA